MNKKETLQAQIEQNQTRIEQNQTKCERLISESRCLLTELTELNEPKLKFGEKVVLMGGPVPIRIVLYDKDGDLRAFCEDGVAQTLPLNEYERTGETIFDDLKAMAEPLEEFKIDKVYKNRGNIHMGHPSDVPGHIYFSISEGDKFTCLHISFDQATEIHRNLGRLIATAKAKE